MPDSQEKLPTDQSSTFSTFWILTRLGTRYELPDMQPYEVDTAHRQLDGGLENVTLRNTSDVIMVIPKRIIQRAGAGNRCFWEAE